MTPLRKADVCKENHNIRACGPLLKHNEGCEEWVWDTRSSYTTSESSLAERKVPDLFHDSIQHPCVAGQQSPAGTDVLYNQYPPIH